ncbi:Short C-terminal domain-containing protein [Halopelagius inordinatus]|uniref:Short C-terminal domain-containing protein n=1 Tax=Halopelagius inordinatus TaxID=553467 RepID=A0A1I2LJB3_9EURY|nr:SHOCT domain-containing protein [Halopelagius inordinatus]SFF78540.1 Short C-terminal domain-containing protein [Halopelagius inordinatus]
MNDRHERSRDGAEGASAGRRTQSDDDGEAWWDGDDWWDDWDEDDGEWAGIASLLVLGLGLASLFGLVPVGPFWAIFAIGFAVVVPLVAILEQRYRESRASAVPPESESRREETDRSDGGEFDDALARIRDRYARGELSEEQFERKLELLLETETPEDARERVRRVREERARREAEAETESES